MMFSGTNFLKILSKKIYISCMRNRGLSFRYFHSGESSAIEIRFLFFSSIQ